MLRVGGLLHGCNKSYLYEQGLTTTLDLHSRRPRRRLGQPSAYMINVGTVALDHCGRHTDLASGAKAYTINREI